MKRAVRAFAGVVIAVLSLSLIGFGQTTSATIMGRVLDPSKAAVVGADVQATNVDTGSTYKGATNGTGLFSIPGVAPGGMGPLPDCPWDPARPAPAGGPTWFDRLGLTPDARSDRLGLAPDARNRGGMAGAGGCVREEQR